MRVCPCVPQQAAHGGPDPARSPLGPMRVCPGVPQQAAHPGLDQTAGVRVANVQCEATSEAEPGQAWGWLEDFSLGGPSREVHRACSGPQHEHVCCARCTEEPGAGCAACERQCSHRDGHPHTSSNSDSSSKSSRSDSSRTDSSSSGGILLNWGCANSQASHFGMSANQGDAMSAAGPRKLMVPDVIDPIWEPVQHVAPALCEQLLNPILSAQLSPGRPEHRIPGQQNTSELPCSASASPIDCSPNTNKASVWSTEHHPACHAAEEVRAAKYSRLGHSESASVWDSKRAKQAESSWTCQANCLLAEPADHSRGPDSHLSAPACDAALGGLPAMPGSRSPDLADAPRFEDSARAGMSTPAAAAEAHAEASSTPSECQGDAQNMSVQHERSGMGATQLGNVVNADVVSWLAAAPLPPLRFFLRGADEIRSVYMPC